MRAVVISRPGGPEVLELRDVPAPRPAPDEVLVRVTATSVNRADILQREGRYPAPPGAPADIPGLEYAGVVEEVGGRVSDWRPGDRVMGIVGGGGYAELVAVPADQAVRVPDSLDLVQAAAVPEAFITAHDALRARAHLEPGEILLIHAVGSGVGTAALQLAKARGATVIGTSRTGWKLERARHLGLDTAVRAQDAAFDDAVTAATDGRGVDVILDLVGGPYLTGNLRCLASLGRIVVVGLTAGRTGEIDLGALLGRRATLVGTVLRSRGAGEKAQAARAFAADVLPLLAAGGVRPIVHAVLDATAVASAHEMVEANATFGCVVLRW